MRRRLAISACTMAPLCVYALSVCLFSTHVAPVRHFRRPARDLPVARSRGCIVFRAPSRGQGIGNSLHGLITAYSMAEILSRDVCIEWPRYDLFAGAKRECPRPRLELEYFNFGKTLSGSELLSRLRQQPEAALRSNAVWNTSKRFPTMFDRFCSQFNTTRHSAVAHIRTGDSPNDARGILRTLDGWSVLRKCLPADAHIITDSRLAFKMLRRDPRNVAGHSEIGKQSKEDLSQTWSDWCTFRQADVLYHTPSGFSESAVYLSHPKRVIRLDETFRC